jgi:hypothetical protein
MLQNREGGWQMHDRQWRCNEQHHTHTTSNAQLMLHTTQILIICARKLLIVCANTNSIEPACVCVCVKV